jgi:hypothetical protein
MELKRNQFPHDPVNRIQNLYYDVNIHTIFNRTKLQNVKNKFVKYVNYLTKYEKNVIQPSLLEYQKIEDEAHEKWNRVTFFYLHNPTPENLEKRKALFPIFRKAEEECEELKCIACGVYIYKGDIHSKINEINKQLRNIYKRYRECAHCEKMAMVAISGCKSKHKLCSVCSDDITECPVCEEDLGLQYCAICMENKKEIVETGCENKHQTCKECLDKIIRKNNVCPFCRDYCSKEPVDPHPASYYLMENGEDIRDLWQDRADDMREGRG